MAEQLNLIKSASIHRKGFVITRKNEALMKQCFRDVYRMGMVSEETMRKVEATDYLEPNKKGNIGLLPKGEE